MSAMTVRFQLASLWVWTCGTFRARCRDRRSLLSAGLILVFCAALVPGQEAGYSLLLAGDKAVSMTADTAMVLAAVLWGVFLFPFLVFMIGGAPAIERVQGAYRILYCAPLRPMLGVAGNLLGGIGMAVCFALLSCLSMVVLAYFKYAGFPAWPVVGMTLLLGAVVVSVALVVAIVLDALVPMNRLGRVVAVIGAWLLLLQLTMLDSFDAFGIGMISNVVSGTGPMTLGFTTRVGVGAVEWHQLAGMAGLAGSRLSMIGAMLVLAGALFVLCWRWMRVRAIARPRRSARARHPAALLAQQVPPVQAAGDVGVCGAAWQLAQWYRRRSRWGWVLAGAALLSCLGSAGIPMAVLLALASVLAGAARDGEHEIRALGGMDACQPALYGLRGLLVPALGLMLPAAVAMLPVVQAGGLRLATVEAGLLCIALCVVLCGRRARRPTLGFASCLLAVYAVVAEGIPPALDFIGFRGAGLPSLITALALSGALCVVELVRLRLQPRGGCRR
ncbi:hypothetical protein [Stenotrophomonas sp. JAI102]|uniref:hypothetical protein n=1 Tax=Stenotrophomonas sp. JAI102 TaxID=2723077 RepID=UPI0015C8E7E3|nr:hypothetical protein [Stenotrophomonas sp. JAI102]NYF35682.1 hypothetical protein [Stenotrophomonas sp. JAI102]